MPPGPRITALSFSFVAGIAGALAFAAGSFVAGGALLTASVVGLRWPRSLWAVEDPPELSSSTRWLCLVGVAAVATFFRFYQLVPPGLWGDDAVNGLLALDILDGKITSPLQIVPHSQSRFHALSNYPVAAAFALLGPSLASLRVPGVLLNLGCTLLLYGTFAPLFRARAALVAAFLFATSPMQVAHGKILLQDVTGQFLHLLGMFFLVRGLTGPRRWQIVLAGVPLGLSLCTYHAFKLVPFIVVAVVTALLLRPRGEATSGSTRMKAHGESRRGLILALAAGALVFAATAAPGIIAYGSEPGALTGRVSGTSLLADVREQGLLLPLWTSLWKTLTIFHYQQGPVLYHWFGVGTDPAVNAIVAALIVHGLVQSILHWKEPRHLVLLTWFAIGIAPGVLSSEAPRVYRILIATAPVFVWAALPVERLLAWGRARQQRAGVALAGLLLLAVLALDFERTFLRVYTHRDYLWMQATRMVDLAQTLEDYGPNWRGVLFSANYDSEHESFRFLRRIWDLDLRDARTPGDVMPLRDEGNVVLLFDPSALETADVLASYYPGAVRQTHRLPVPHRSWAERLSGARAEAGVLSAHIALPHRAAEGVRGLNAVLLDHEGAPVGTARWPRLVADFAEIAPGTASIIVTGAIYAPKSGEYAFSLEAPSGASLWIDGHRVLSPEQRSGQLELLEGLHSLRAAIDDPGHGQLEIRWQPPGEAMQSIAPALLYAEGNPGGWIAEVRGVSATTRRIEALPFYELFRAPLEGRYTAVWRGRLRVPSGGRELIVHAKGTPEVVVDGTPGEPSRHLSPGLHDVEITLAGVEGSAMLKVLWRSDDRPRAVPVPLDAFLPPL